MTSPNLEDVTGFADAPEDRCACVLLLDVSNSMTGDPIRMVNDAIRSFKDEVSRDALSSQRVQIAVVAFNHEVNIKQDFIDVSKFKPPVLTASGGTKIAGAVNRALDMLDQQKKVYRANDIGVYRPIVLLITDGYPEHDTPEEIDEAARRISEEEVGRHVVFFAFGIKGADMGKLAEISVRKPRRVDEAQISEIFQWLSDSVSMIAESQPGDRLALPTPPGDTDY